MADSANDAFRPLYAVSIQDTTRSGDQQRMREMEQRAQQYISEVRSALDELRAALGRHQS